MNDVLIPVDPDPGIGTSPEMARVSPNGWGQEVDCGEPEMIIEQSRTKCLNPGTKFVETVIGFTPRVEGMEWYAADRDRSQIPLEYMPVRIHDIRGVADELSFDRNGFVLLDRPSAVSDLRDPSKLEREYLPEIEAIARELTGAEKAICFGTVVRSDGQGVADISKPARQAHVDFDGEGVRHMAVDVLGQEEADYWLARRHMQMNFWRPIGTVSQAPLALADASLLNESDFISVAIHGGLGERHPRPFNSRRVVYREDINWWYAPQMLENEMWAFKLFDSNDSKVQFTAHTAFDDPTSPPDVPPRESVEVRVICFMPE